MNGTILYLPKELCLIVVSLLNEASRYSLSWTSIQFAKHVRLYRVSISQDFLSFSLDAILYDVISNEYLNLFKQPIFSIYVGRGLNTQIYCELAAELGSFEIWKYILMT